MSLFGAGGLRPPGASSQAVNEEKVEAASSELLAVAKLFSWIQDSCHSKCINKKYYEGDLTTGEAACLDRCVSKFFGTHNVMNEIQSQQQGGQ